MKQSISIRRANTDHVQMVASLFDDYRQFYGQPADLKGAQDFLTERLMKSESVVFLAIDESNTKGVGFVQLYPSFTSVGLQRKWILNDLFVTSGQRSGGVGRGLMQAATQFAQQSGAQGLVLETQVTNQGAQALYESLGWVREDDFYVYTLSLVAKKDQ